MPPGVLFFYSKKRIFASLNRCDMTKETAREKEIYRVTLAGSLINLLLLIFKFVAGILGHSAAMIADAVHSLSDFVTDVVVIVFVRISNKPQDKDHDYGHGKYETLATAVIGIVLLAVGTGILWSALTSIWTVWRGGALEAPRVLALWAALLSIALKELAYRFTARIGRRLDSPAVVANAWHHRSDAFSSVGSALGIGGAILLGERWHVLDPIAAVVVSLFIMRVAVKLLHPCVDELTERSLPDEVEAEIVDTVLQVAGVSGVHNLRTRRIGTHYAIEMHVRMDGGLTLLAAHERASCVERRLKARYGPETHLGIHVEPVKVNGHYVAAGAEAPAACAADKQTNQAT